MKVLLMGLGAIGTVYSCLMKESGHEVYGIDRPEVLEAIRRQGVYVEGIWGTHHAQLDGMGSSIDELAEKNFDLILVSVKTNQTEEICQQLAGFIHPDTFIILAQNGYGNFDISRRYLSSERIILARIIFGAETISAGKSRVTVIADDVVIGFAENGDPAYLQDLADRFCRAGIPTRPSTEVSKYIWGKVIYNSALNPLGAILGLSYGQLAEMNATRAIMNEIIEEIFAVLAASGQETMWKDADNYINDFYQRLLPPTAGHHASMLQDFQRMRPTEIDALNGAVVRLGQQYQVPTPVNQVITNLVKAREMLYLQK